MKKRNIQKGFTLVELMIVIAIVGILAAVAMPMYSAYTEKAKFLEVISMTAGVKKAVEICYMTVDPTGASCNSGLSGVPANFGPLGNLATLQTALTGNITATALDSGLTYILTPTFTANEGVAWGIGGTCVAANVC